MKLKYKIKEVKPNIFAVIVKDNYDRAMLFCRGQEYYESPNKKFRGKYFSIWDYIEWYSREHGDVFTYTFDWGGFNIPFDVIDKCYSSCEMETPYDDVMYEIVCEIERKKDDKKKAYIIGADSLESDTFEHETCHGLYYTNKEYKALVDEITIAIPIKDYLTFRNNLKNMGYTDSVMNDEIQAYLTTNWDYKKFMNGVDKKVCKELHKQYNNIFSKF